MKAETVFTLLHFIVIVKTAEIANKACFANHEMRFFCDAENFRNAKRACEDDDSSLVKIDNANMTKVVNALIDKAVCKYRNDFFIGAKASHDPDFPNDGSKRIWRWLDGSKVYLPSEPGYQNWGNGQPNDIRGREDCLILDGWNKQWKDGPCSGVREAKYFICQKKAILELNIKAIPNAKQCMATAGICSTHTEWRLKGLEIVSNNSSFNVYQKNFNNSSILHYKNAEIGDAGEYICVAWIENEKANPMFTSVNISVNGTPVITDPKSFICNTCLQVMWKPRYRSLGYQHRIKASESSTGQLVKFIVITPYEKKQYFTEIAYLEPFTEYVVKVVACKDNNICTDEYTTVKSASTLGKVVTVTNATIQQYSGICNVTWKWHDGLTETFQIITYLGSRSTPNGSISRQTLFTKNNHYWFPSLSGQEYTVEIQPVTNKTYCSKPVRAVGSCIGKDSPDVCEQTLVAPVVILSIIVFMMSLVIVSMAILLRKRATEIVQQAQTYEARGVHEYETVKIPDINGADYLYLTDNSAAQINIETSAEKITYENIDRNLSPTYETVNNKPVSEYEM